MQLKFHQIQILDPKKPVDVRLYSNRKLYLGGDNVQSAHGYINWCDLIKIFFLNIPIKFSIAMKSSAYKALNFKSVEDYFEHRMLHNMIEKSLKKIQQLPTPERKKYRAKCFGLLKELNPELFEDVEFEKTKKGYRLTRLPDLQKKAS